MKPSEPKCGSDHDYFVLKAEELFRENDLHEYNIKEFEKPLYNKSGYFGSVDIFLSKANEKEQYVSHNKIFIGDFKPKLDKITDTVRQLRVYQNHFYQFIDKPRDTTKKEDVEIGIFTYEDEITEERKKICETLGVKLIGIQRKDTKQKKLK